MGHTYAGESFLDSRTKNQKSLHVVLNNSCHESVGGQRTAISQTSKENENVFNFADIAQGLGYSAVHTAQTREEIQDLNTIVNTRKQSTFIEIITGVNLEHNKRLPRPKDSLAQQKHCATQFCAQTKALSVPEFDLKIRQNFKRIEFFS